MHPFDYAAPRTLDESLALLAEHGADARVLAGGQSLIPILNYRLAKPRLIVDLGAIALRDIRADSDRVTLGALVRHCDLDESRDLAALCPLLGEAARLIGNVRVRSLGTLGGSLAHADPAGELPLAMVTLSASLRLASVRGVRVLAANDFFAGYLATALAPDEILTAVEVLATRGSGTAMEEVARRAGDFAIVASAAVLRVDRRGRVDEARLAYGGIGPRPLRVPRAEDALVGHEPTAERVAGAARLARSSIAPPGDALVSAPYRSLLIEVLGRRALGRAAQRALAAA